MTLRERFAVRIAPRMDDTLVRIGESSPRTLLWKRHQKSIQRGSNPSFIVTTRKALKARRAARISALQLAGTTRGSQYEFNQYEGSVFSALANRLIHS